VTLPLIWKYGKAEVPDSVKPITLEDVKKKDEIIKKAKAGELIERKSDEPAKSAALRTFNVFVDNEYFNVEVDPTGEMQVVSAAPAVAAAPVPAAAPAPVAPSVAAEPAPAADTDGALLLAPMPGMIVKYLVNEGDSVTKGDAVVVLEAMKMENSLTAPADGVVKSIKFVSGDSVAKGAVLCVIG